MRNIGKAALALLLGICLLAGPLTLPAQAVQRETSAPNITRYLPYGETEPSAAHTIHWARGITPPTMPGQLLEDGTALAMEQADFTMISAVDQPVTPDTNPTAYGYYVAPYDQGNGWYDINKASYYAPDRGIDDLPMCFAASAANAVHWWIDQNDRNIRAYLELVQSGAVQQDPALADPMALQAYLDSSDAVTRDPATSLVYAQMHAAFRGPGQDGGYPNLTLDTFFNGYWPVVMDRPNQPDKFRPYAQGGFFHPVFGTSTISYSNWYTRYEVLDKSFGGFFDSGYAVMIGYQHLDGAHAVTVWGAEYDAQGHLCGIFITDSNDAGDYAIRYRDWNGQPQITAMKRYDVFAKADTGIAAIDTHTVIDTRKGTPIQSVYLLTAADEAWSYFLEHHQPQYPDGRGLITYDDYLDPKPPAAAEPGWSVDSLTAEGAQSPQDIPQGMCQVRAEITRTGPAADAVLLTAAYDAAGRQLSVRTTALQNVSGRTACTVTLDNQDGRAAALKAFLVSGDGSAVPLSAHAVYPAA